MSFMAKRMRAILIKECETLQDEAKISGYRVEVNTLIGATVCTILVGNKQLSYAVTDLEVEKVNMPLVDHVRDVLRQILARLEAQ